MNDVTVRPGELAPADAFESIIKGGTPSESIEKSSLMPGRPRGYRDAIGAEVCQRIASGETLTAICLSEHMPNITTFYRWLYMFPTLAKAYYHARQLSADSLAYRAIDAADAATGKEDASAAKVKADTYLRVASRLNPQQWGERKDATQAVQINIHSNLDDPRVDMERRGEYSIVIEDAEEVSHDESAGQHDLPEPEIEI